MATATAAQRAALKDIRDQAARMTAGVAETLLDRVRKDPAALMVEAGLAPDPWQRRVLSSRSSEVLMKASRQSGKSQVASAVALSEALLNAGALVLLLSPTLRQSGELFRDKLVRLWRALGSPLAAGPPTQLSLELANGSRIVSLPGTEDSIRGFSKVALLVIDEAARVPDPLYYSVRPMLAVSRGRMVVLSSAYAKVGWYYEAWTKGDGWDRYEVKASQCPRISREFLARERRELGQRWYEMEYEGVFADLVDAVFAGDDIEAALSDEVEPLFGARR